MQSAQSVLVDVLFERCSRIMSEIQALNVELHFGKHSPKKHRQLLERLAEARAEYADVSKRHDKLDRELNA